MQAAGLYKFSSYFTTKEILRQVCKQLVKLRRNRRNKAFMAKFSGKHGYQLSENEAFLDSMFPPRMECPGPGQKLRRKCYEQGRDPYVEVLYRHILSRWSEHNATAPDWLKRLRRFVDKVRHRALRWSEWKYFEQPTIIPLLKKKDSETGINEYRCVAKFKLADNVIISLAAKYFRSIFDSVFHENTLAFRVQQPGEELPNHHMSVDMIQDARSFLVSRNRNIWVSEVDIQSFYDCVDHHTAMKYVTRLNRMLPRSKRMDRRAKAMLKYYLEMYSFNREARPEALQILEEKCAPGSFQIKWPQDEMDRLHGGVGRKRIGIPQGGALSCFLVNAILHFADEAVLDIMKPELGDRYIRYCDDIMILSGSKRRCEQMLKAYRNALVELKLPEHPPMEATGQAIQDGWLDGKSWKPYLWSASGEPGTVPWISSTGYQHHRNGRLRIHPKSVAAQVQKQRQLFKEVMRAIENREDGLPPLDVDRAVRLFGQKLRHLLFGRNRRSIDTKGTRACWIDGFQMTHTFKGAGSQLRELEKCINRYTTKTRLKFA